MKFQSIQTGAGTYQNLRKTSLIVGGSLCTVDSFLTINTTESAAGENTVKQKVRDYTASNFYTATCAARTQ